MPGTLPGTSHTMFLRLRTTQKGQRYYKCAITFPPRHLLPTFSVNGATTHVAMPSTNLGSSFLSPFSWPPTSDHLPCLINFTLEKVLKFSPCHQFKPGSCFTWVTETAPLLDFLPPVLFPFRLFSILQLKCTSDPVVLQVNLKSLNPVLAPPGSPHSHSNTVNSASNTVNSFSSTVPPAPPSCQEALPRRLTWCGNTHFLPLHLDEDCSSSKCQLRTPLWESHCTRVRSPSSVSPNTLVVPSPSNSFAVL